MRGVRIPPSPPPSSEDEWGRYRAMGAKRRRGRGERRGRAGQGRGGNATGSHGGKAAEGDCGAVGGLGLKRELARRGTGREASGCSWNTLGLGHGRRWPRIMGSPGRRRASVPNWNSLESGPVEGRRDGRAAGRFV